MTTIATPVLELARRANLEHRQAEASAHEALEHARQAGEYLTQAKDACPHGTWLAWLEANFEGDPRTAQRYMRVHQHWPEIEANATRVSHLSLRAALDALSAPEEEPEEPNTTRVSYLEEPKEPEIIPPDPAMAGINPKDQQLILRLVNELTEGQPTESAARSLAAVAQGIINTGTVETGDGEQKPWGDLTPEEKRAALMSGLEAQTFERMQQHRQRKTNLGKSIADPILEKLTLPKEQVGELRTLAKHAPESDRKSYEKRWRDKL